VIKVLGALADQQLITGLAIFIATFVRFDHTTYFPLQRVAKLGTLSNLAIIYSLEFENLKLEPKVTGLMVIECKIG
jgi:hypothetical protein